MSALCKGSRQVCWGTALSASTGARVPRHCQISRSQGSSCIHAEEEAVTLHRFWCACQTPQKTTGSIQTENDTTYYEKYTQEVVYFSPAENSFSLFCFRLPFFAVKYAAINLTDKFSSGYFPLQQTTFKLSLVMHSITSEIQSPSISMQEKYFLPFRLQPFSCFNECTDLHIHTY